MGTGTGEIDPQTLCVGVRDRADGFVVPGCFRSAHPRRLDGVPVVKRWIRRDRVFRLRRLHEGKKIKIPAGGRLYSRYIHGEVSRR
jgi:hypothetical protein